MQEVLEELLNPIVSFETNDKESEKVLFRVPKNHLFYALKDNKTAICYDKDEEKIRDIKIKISSL